MLMVGQFTMRGQTRCFKNTNLGVEGEAKKNDILKIERVAVFDICKTFLNIFVNRGERVLEEFGE